MYVCVCVSVHACMHVCECVHAYLRDALEVMDIVHVEMLLKSIEQWNALQSTRYDALPALQLLFDTRVVIIISHRHAHHHHHPIADPI
jgi:hypothetical protein